MKRILPLSLAIAILFASFIVLVQTASAQQFTPNSNITSGNTYNGTSISGVGGAIASCTNVGGFLVNSASDFLSQTFGGDKVKALYQTANLNSAVSVSDAQTQAKLDASNKQSQCLDGIAYAVAKNTLAQVTNKTLNWVNTGLNGSPFYVQNAGSYLNSIENQQLQSFLGTVQNSDPIFGNALRSSITLQLTGQSDGKINTSLNTPQATAYNSFMTDFTNGGWDALLNPANNPIGAFFNAADTVTDNINTQQQQASNEIQRNNGFLDMKQCVQYAPAGNGLAAATSSDYITTSGTHYYCSQDYSSQDIAEATAACGTDDGSDAWQSCAAPVDQKYDNLAKTNCSTTPPVAAGATGNTSLAIKQGLSNVIPQCQTYQTVTPGSVIAAQVNSITTSPTRQLEYADKINEVLGSFFDSFVNSLLSKGLRGSGTSDSQFANLGFGSQGDNTLADTTGQLGYQSSGTGGIDTGDFDISRPQQLRAVLQTQYDFVNRVEDSQVALAKVIPAIGALDYCIPGPNPEWRTGLDSNWQAFVGSITQEQKDQDTASKILSNVPVIGGLLGLFGAGGPQQIWSAQAALSDKVTGNSIAINRVFSNPSTSLQGGTGEVIQGLTNGFTADVGEYDYYGENLSLADPTSVVGQAFRQAAIHDTDQTYVDGFLADAYTQIDSLVGYNQEASTIDKQYDQDISDTQNDIRQLELIRTEVNGIVATAKTRYIAQRAAAGDPVNLQCINQAYVIDNSPIVPVARQEPNTVDPMVQHSIDSASYFYNNQAI